MFAADAITAVDRRTLLLRSAVLLVGGSLAGLPGAALAQDAPAARFFTPGQFAVLAELVETIIPQTDTPGAKEAGVPEAMDALMTHWASADRQDQFRRLIEEIGGSGLLALPAPERHRLVARIDAEKLAARDPVYGRFKELVLTLYYLSETGATKELRYELIPGKWEPATTVGTDTRGWAV